MYLGQTVHLKLKNTIFFKFLFCCFFLFLQEHNFDLTAASLKAAAPEGILGSRAYNIHYQPTKEVCWTLTPNTSPTCSTKQLQNP